MADPSANHHHLAPLRSALKQDDDADRTSTATGSLKAVQIAEPSSSAYYEDEPQYARHSRRAVPARLLSGVRMPGQTTGLSTRSSASGSPIMRGADEPSPPGQDKGQSHTNSRRIYQSEKLLAQVSDWLERERKKVAAKKLKPRRRKSKSPPEDKDHSGSVRARSGSLASDTSEVSLDGLQSIIEKSMASMGISAVPRFSPRKSPSKTRRPPSRASLHRTASSDTDYIDGDIIVPSCDAWLDNSKTLNSSDFVHPYGDHGDSVAPPLSARAEKEKDSWLVFKNDILRITHTLRLKGWRKVPLGSGEALSVTRLSGALTNAVYVVTPPPDLPAIEMSKRPTRILLRIYGPQIEHLIDRENELHVLQRLARKKIGPRLLGTFKNGRFEQFFNAITLTPWDLRIPETYKQIAKRMRELHDGIELLHHERDGGPAVWRSWEQWLDTVAEKTTFLDGLMDKQIDKHKQSSALYAWRQNGYVLGAPWEQFKAMVEKYKAYLDRRYGDQQALQSKLIFAHNDTQHGNILRIRPDDEESPLLQPANKHKQLIVIDFEYAGANTAGFEFANHFVEWAYNYTDAVTSWAFNVERYPTAEERRRFIRAYVDHRPHFPQASFTPRLSPLDAPAFLPNTHTSTSNTSSTSSTDTSTTTGANKTTNTCTSTTTNSNTGPSSLASTPRRLSAAASTSSIVDFMLDARYPGGDWSAAERAREEQTERHVAELMDETNLWRPANSAHWIAWGIVQAKVPAGMGGAAEDEELSADAFDYLRYAQDRAFCFWGDCVQRGLVGVEELPVKLQERLKMLD